MRISFCLLIPTSLLTSSDKFIFYLCWPPRSSWSSLTPWLLHGARLENSRISLSSPRQDRPKSMRLSCVFVPSLSIIKVWTAFLCARPKLFRRLRWRAQLLSRLVFWVFSQSEIRFFGIGFFFLVFGLYLVNEKTRKVCFVLIRKLIRRKTNEQRRNLILKSWIVLFSALLF